ncbi:TraR protein [Pseudomonas coronafaciens pv. garcae]|uniref:DUF6750 family protein n=1 Tax=Pseudomonas syringae group TaxID=136849 RepID=UPI000EFF9CE3|nr:DUF6750 family protein [Pseudomonas coronafaciens]RMS09309.1 TraR protein [Pseudomonas coronafaciens pv. garcae]
MSRHMLLSVCVRATLLQDKVRQRFIKGLAAFIAASPVMAFAAGEDLASMVTSTATGGVTVTKGALSLAQMVGVVFVIGALAAAKAKKDNPQIKVSHIATSLVIGACLIAVPEIIKRSQAQVGLAPISVG